jgi:hypothetical protein
MFAFGNMAVLLFIYRIWGLPLKWKYFQSFFSLSSCKSTQKSVVQYSVDVVSRAVRPSILRASCFQTDWSSTNFYACLSFSSCPKITKPCENEAAYRFASLPKAFDISLFCTTRKQVPPFSLLPPTYRGSTGNLVLGAVVFEDNTDQ